MRPAPTVWRCEECIEDPECLEARGFCTCTGLKRSCGADHGMIEASVAISSGASHLGTYSTCPIAFVLRYKDLLNAALQEYSLIKRLNIRNDYSVSPKILLAIDQEVSKIEALEMEDEHRKTAASHSKR